MSVFFFDTMSNGLSTPDEEGSETETDEAARVVALATLSELVKRRPPFDDRQTYSVTIRREAERPFYRAALVISGEWLDHTAPAAA